MLDNRRTAKLYDFRCRMVAWKFCLLAIRGIVAYDFSGPFSG